MPKPRHLARHMALVAALLAPALLAAADEVIWLNVSDYPGGLEKTDAAWSAIRIEENNFSNRVAADDFILREPRRITAIEFWTVTLTDNPLLGIDWYIFDGPAEGPPGALIAYGSDVPTPHADTGLVNAIFGPLYLERAEVNVPLDAGHYFLAFRSVHQNAGQKGNGALTTHDQLGTSRGWWNFQLSADGLVGAFWNPMSDFSGKDTEWAFRILASVGEECYPDCTGEGELDFFDFLCYLNAFDNQDPYADCEANGVFDFFDFLCYLNAFDAGC